MPVCMGHPMGSLRLAEVDWNAETINACMYDHGSICWFCCVHAFRRGKKTMSVHTCYRGGWRPKFRRKLGGQKLPRKRRVAWGWGGTLYYIRGMPAALGFRAWGWWGEGPTFKCPQGPVLEVGPVLKGWVGTAPLAYNKSIERETERTKDLKKEQEGERERDEERTKKRKKEQHKERKQIQK